jgi:ABC-type transport system involved in cytochrome bd biosynthesis fused ATPase/permease subunit
MSEKAISIIISIIAALLAADCVQKAIYAEGIFQLIYIAIGIYYAAICVKELINPAVKK